MKKLLILVGLLLIMFPVISSASPKTTTEADYFEIQRPSGEASYWNGYKFGAFGDQFEYKNDFFEYTAGDWTITTTENGAGSATEALTDAVGGVLRISLDNSVNDADGLQLGAESFKPAVAKEIFCVMRVSLSDSTDSSFVGGLVVTDTSPASHANGIVFAKDDTNTQWDFETTASSVASADSNIHTATDDTFVKLAFKVTGTSRVEYWIDDVSQGALTTNIPTTEMRPTIYYLNGTEGDSETMDIDYFFCAQDR